MTSELKDPEFHVRLTEIIGQERPFSWAAKAGLSKGAFSRIWNEGTVPSPDLLKKISAATGYSIDWLLTGEGPMRRGDAAPAAVSQPVAATHPDLNCLPSDNLGLGEMVELLAKICNSGHKNLIRAIAANLNAFSEAIDNKELALQTLAQMKQMEEREKRMEERIMAMEQKLADMEAAPKKVANG
jgi:transcriptional regulator with XRE-family HTH domain